MSKLEELLNKECPDGVEYVPLWSVTIWDKKFNSVDKDKQKTTIKYKYYLADELKQLVVENGDVKILTTNISNLFTLEKLVSNSLNNGEIVCIPWGGNPIVQYYKGKFITSDNRIATSIDVNKLDNKFLYYVLINKLDLISSFYRGAGIKHPDMSKVLDIIIPIPPIEVQKEIVRILDEFTEKTTKLQELLHKETVLRKKQYEYYQNKLLFNTKFDKIKMSDICTVNQGLQIPISQRKKEDGKNRYFYITVQFLKGNNQDKYYIENPSENVICDTDDILVTRTGSTGKIITGVKGCFHNNFFKLNFFDNVNRRYVYYVLSTKKMYEEMLNAASGGTVPDLTHKAFYKLEIYFPPLEEQERIVNILDKFDALCNDITRGLPAEIEMRKKQYEYYRDKLLTFKEKKK